MLSTRPAAMQKSRPSLQVSGHVLELYHSTHSDQRQNLAVVETCYRAYTQLTAKVDKLKAAIDTEKQRMDTQRSQAEERGTQLDTSQRECRHLKTQVDDLEERISGINIVHTQQALYSSISTCTDQSLRIRKLESQLAEKTTFEAEQQRRIVELERQSSYIRSLLDRFGYKDLKSAPTPLEGKQRLVPYEGEISEEQRKLFQAMIGCLSWLALASRPDIAYAVANFSRHSKQPGPPHLGCIKRTMTYLAGAVNLKP
ncbi:hypothetical protein CF327_g6965 [Tilletia walkeri]|nr:hypothetical protein CF327_g6965 [Tilletia walkeri]